jgi:hypothetical protein
LEEEKWVGLVRKKGGGLTGIATIILRLTAHRREGGEDTGKSKIK